MLCLYKFSFFIVGEFILWNSEQVSLIYQADDFQNATTFREDQKLTNNSVLWEGVYYSKNVPTYLSFPMLGTQDIDTGDVNFLYLPTPTTLYMLKKEEWKGVDVNDWEFTGDEGNFLGAKIGKLKIYKKDYPSGRHRINNKSALYLFDAQGNNLLEYDSFRTCIISIHVIIKYENILQPYDLFDLKSKEL